MPEGAAINRMFGEIAHRYDAANHLLSGGVDYYWRRVLVGKVARANPQVIVDLATGSGDVAFAIRNKLPASVELAGLDFCEPMLDEARAKQKERYGDEAIRFAFGDCLNLPLADESTDVITIAFGVRNFEDRIRGLQEMRRSLRPGGRLLILEFSQPYAWFRPFYYVYLKCILPTLASLVTGKKDAYSYLADSIEGFPARDTLSAQILKAGFAEVSATPLTFGIVAIHEAVR
ncbi:bifunctional demethylmenaquinone methyltransferase/2-methoxy-6-polyprenyl-1,4-benzoquinol methylase UbiE [Cerasicoccus arenae]|uniref:Demethylmenaquinone methyltransferase n=1 Tax=Cerasicoccus arenae TaxID=424488 RepID=A0A8J3DE91_9BACT|nr:bifunctional demethylmenaquinone methyltransferase/2-methoxy-6-polyprenyl-1,4-benzoquinol methylase UbiE [Cerasicoccus arenae]MBK1858371.1 bifunctional demethylmenaquinone methyltransferase/2-methoxy-6-polyprenyl-1,4-benzoquinol methylase UbiE [Cerasicoccus arenae]GHC09865.1 demethylmenaquinone methyltransferase [Cerasicoccus arenae]